MNPPICRLCKNPHWPRDPHVWEDVPVPAQFDIGQPETPLPHQRLMIEAVEAVEKGERFQFFAPSEVPKKVAPEAPRSNAPSPSPRSPDTKPKIPRTSREDRSARQSPDIADTAPSMTPVTRMTDEELRPYFNEVMRRKMKLRRAKGKT